MIDLYVTEIKAICPIYGFIKTYSGPNVPGISLSDAQYYCDTNGLGYCKVIGKLVAEIPCKDGTYEPDWDNEINYENPKLN
jgi:hypothetical protein